MRRTIVVKALGSNSVLNNVETREFKPSKSVWVSNCAARTSSESSSESSSCDKSSV